MIATARKTHRLTAAAINRAGGSGRPVAAHVDGTREVGELATRDHLTYIHRADGSQRVLGGSTKLVEVELNDDGTLYIATPEAETQAEFDAQTDAYLRLHFRVNHKLEQARSAVEAIRSGIADDIAEGTPSADDLARRVNALAEAEGELAVWARLGHAADQGDFGAAMIREVTADMLLAGADDGWSGRTNDVKRARFDGVRSAVSNARWLAE